jgi:protein SCO1
MKFNPKKGGILVVILVIPTFFFLLAHFTGENHFDLPRLGAIGTKDTVVDGQKRVDTIYHQVGNMSFETHHNRGLLETNKLRGNVVVYSAIFTTCKTICPQITSNLTKVYEVFKESPEIRLVSISVNPITDTRKVLQSYATMFDVTGNSWSFVRNNSDALTYQFLNKELYLAAGREVGNKTDFFHSEKVVLVDKEGFIRGYFDATDGQEVDELIGAIKILKNNYDNNAK